METTTTTTTKITTDTNFITMEPKVVYITKVSIFIILCIQDHFSLYLSFLIYM